ncbi:MAG: DUF2723 domain-containing protein, partial [Verrucomicrobia bacterium]|nr:DUF2723 domain-containing protein [Verrucomicrobiota bacterium]
LRCLSSRAAFPACPIRRRHGMSDDTAKGSEWNEAPAGTDRPALHTDAPPGLEDPEARPLTPALSHPMGEGDHRTREGELGRPSSFPPRRISETLPRSLPFFRRRDWASLGLTTALALVNYLVTLAPQVTLEFSGVLSVGAMYAGVPHPPGFPLWTLYAWFFSVLLPFSNVAWRIAVSSAVAASLACGLVALMVSRVAEGGAGFDRLEPRDERLLQVGCGCVAGLGLAFDGGVWRRAVVVDPWPLSLLLLATVLCFLMRWLQTPERKRYLYGAFLFYGLALTNSQALVCALFGLQVLVMLGNPKLGRDLFFANTLWALAVLAALLTSRLNWLDNYGVQASQLWQVYLVLGLASAALCMILVMRSRALLTEWKTFVVSVGAFLLGLSLYFYVPVASMTNPPVNWGYARTWQGFIHVVTRGQYERIHLTDRFSSLAEQLWLYADIAVTEFGLSYLVVALAPFWFWRRLPAMQKRWMTGLSAVYVCLTLVMLVGMNPSSDRTSRDMVCKVLFSASHLMLATWAGYGLILIGLLIARRPRGAEEVTAKDHQRY